MRVSRIIAALLLAVVMLLPPRFCCGAMAQGRSEATGQMPCCSDSEDEPDTSSDRHSRQRPCNCGCCTPKFLAVSQSEIRIDGLTAASVFVVAPPVVIPSSSHDPIGVSSRPRYGGRQHGVLHCRWNC